MLKLLKSYFGYEQFLPLQKEVIDNVLVKKDGLVLMPTGGGKSLCYQLPALKFSGLTLVISPLIALMKDQVDALKANGIPAAFINSSLALPEISEIMTQVQSGKIKILYLAPERLAIPSFQEFINSCRLSLIAIDEAHCISEWGHDFRPDYRNLNILRKNYANVPVIALTATATKKVREDIVDQLNIQKGRVFISSFNRANLTYLVRPKADAFIEILDLLKKYKKESAIIYCFSRKDTENLAADLRSENFNALPYHAGLDKSVRRQTQEKFIRDEVSIVVATIAFGMGIDKPNIRLIVHYNLPKTLEGYYQETGRAGRDNLPSECVLFYSYGDKLKQDFFIGQIEDETERCRAQEKLAQVINYCELQTCRRQFLLEYFGEIWDKDNCKNCDACLAPQQEFDATEITQKIISAVIRTDQRFGAKYIIEVLRGSGSKKICERGHQSLSVYGIVEDYSSNEMKKVINDLLNEGLLIKEGVEYPTLRVSKKGWEFLQKRQKIFLKKPQEISMGDRTGRDKTLEYDQELFEKLRTLRKNIAQKSNLPPFIIFGDVSLQEMAYYFPKSLENFLRISGVGRKKMDKFGKTFLSLIKKYARQNNMEEKPIPARRSTKDRVVKRSSSTYSITKSLVVQQLPLKEIAQRRRITEGTVIGHLEKLISANEELDIKYLKLPPERFDKIKQAFTESGSYNLSPVKEILGEEFSYDELKIARMFLLSSDICE